MRKKTIIFFIFLFSFFIGGGILLFGNQVYLLFSLKIKELEKSLPQIAQLSKREKIQLPPPLKMLEQKKPGFLSRQGIIAWTNIERGKEGLPPLKENSLLNQTAQFKADDILKNQYFSHQSPLGQDVKDLAKKFNYQFLLIGENLALGTFSSDKELVSAWMQSPGHRENILNNGYHEIGIGLKKGIFEGKIVWVAVQHFGSPTSLCSQPDPALKAKIEQNQTQLKNLEGELISIKNKIKSISFKNLFPGAKDEYAKRIEKYNQLVSQYNKILDQEESLIKEYNSQVKDFNHCLEQFIK